MIVHSIRLKNIKCYGSGPDGNGITVSFQPGTNCVAGRNGSGKTTLIEALGYALFLTEPEFEERFTLATYFLRAGENAGEIDVTFTHGGQSYRVEKSLGSAVGRRRSKVVQLSDGSTCALDDAEVSAFLCRLLGFKEPNQLAELFGKLVGVKQGRLAWPFDSKPAAAKEFFEPLLQVAVFRESATRLAEAQRHFDALTTEQRQTMATLEERIRERADSPDKVRVCEERSRSLRESAENARQAKLAAEKRLIDQERRQTALSNAKSALEAARNTLNLATQQRQTEGRLVGESEAAAETVRVAAAGYDAFVKAEASLRAFQRQQNEKSECLRLRAETVKAQAELAGNASSARQQAANYRTQVTVQLDQVNALRQQLDQNQRDLAATRDSFDRMIKAAAAARRAQDAMGAWVESLGCEVKEHAAALSNLLRDWERIREWDPRVATQARAEEERIEAAARDCARKSAKAEEIKEQLAVQLNQIRGGICPFLKVKCGQFDPNAIQSDLGQREREWQEAQRQHKEAVEAQARARSRSESLARQETAVATLRASLAVRVTAWIQQPDSWLSPMIQTHWATLVSYLPDASEGLSLPPLARVEAESCWQDSVLDTAKLDRVAADRRAFAQAATRVIGAGAAALDLKIAETERQRIQRLRQEQDLFLLKKNRDKADAEVAGLNHKVELLEAEAVRAETQSAAAAQRLQQIEERLRPLANLEQVIQEQQSIKDRHVEDHRSYLGAKPQADQLLARRAALEQAARGEGEAREAVRLRTEEFESASREFNVAALETARAEAASAATTLAMAEQAHTQADQELKRERERFGQWQEACAARERVSRELTRLEAAAELAKFAGRILKLSAPAVAQHLCSRIAMQAQRLFNEIHPEPIELEWNAEPSYGLRISPGDRRFAMLSGGEQTKLALAMTLAMIHEFSSLRFAVFDEPTYAVDADSRAKLADAIVAAQKAAGLEQLILVSHDDTFEGYIENVVLLRKQTGPVLAASN